MYLFYLYRTDTEQHLTALCVSHEAQSEIFRLLRQDTSLSESNSALIIHSVVYQWGDRWLTGSSLRDLCDRHMNMASATTEMARHTNTRGQSPGRLLTEQGYRGVNYLVRSVIAPVIGMIDIPAYQAPTGTYQASRL
jgi:hypothetical protein